ncbi:MAG TPA: hypothetical protein VFZ52_17015 [Chryseolinea sp.]
MEKVILVNEQAHGIGSMDSLDAHRKRVLHGELFIVIFNYRNDVPLQIRSRQNTRAVACGPTHAAITRRGASLSMRLYARS